MSKVMIVGASRGIGLELTKQYAEAGDQVIACARDTSEAQKLDSLAEGSANIVIKELDIGDPKSIESAKSENKVAQEVLKEPVTGDTGEAPASTSTDGVLDDTALANQKLAQAKGFETEAARLREEAYELDSNLKPRRGRPAKK